MLANTTININGNTKLNTTAEGLRNIDLKLAFAMTEIHFGDWYLSIFLFLRSEKSSFFVQQKEQSPWLPLLFSKFLNSMNQITDWQIIAVEVVGGS